MKRVLLIVIAAVVFAMSVVPKAAFSYSDIDENMSDYEWQVIYLTNTQRLINGLEPLTAFSKLNYVADIRAREISQRMDHVRPNGTPWNTAFDENGIDYMTAGENIAGGYSTPEDVVEAWMNSEGHRANILSEYSHIGVGNVGIDDDMYNIRWVQMFIGNTQYESIWIEQRGKLPKFGADTKLSDIADSMCYTVAAKTTDGITCYMPLMSEFCSGISKITGENASEILRVTVEVFGYTTTFDVVPDQSASVLTGDANDDGKVNTADAVIVLKFAAEMVNLSEKQRVNADINSDKAVNTADAVAILRLCID